MARNRKTCAVCGVSFTPSNPHNATCSHACGHELRRRNLKTRPKPPPRHRCEICGTPYRLSYSGQRTCGRECGKVLRARNNPPKPKPEKAGPRPRPCTVCGKLFVGTAPHAKYCGYGCRITVAGARVNDLYALACQHGWSGARWRTLLVGYLRERDSDRCQICRRAIRFDLRSGPRGDPSGMGPSVDHIIPRSQRGDDGLSNLRLAHWRCNWERRARGGNEQLMLFG